MRVAAKLNYLFQSLDSVMGTRAAGRKLAYLGDMQDSESCNFWYLRQLSKFLAKSNKKFNVTTLSVTNFVKLLGENCDECFT